MPYLAIVRTEDNKIAKYMSFEGEADADAHVVTHGGFVVQEPTQPYQFDFCTVDAVAKTITTHEPEALAANNMKLWERDMTELDGGLPRYAEDIITAMNPVDRASISQTTRDKLTAKELRRSQRP